jgi:hypothetical protein
MIGRSHRRGLRKALVGLWRMIRQTKPPLHPARILLPSGAQLPNTHPQKMPVATPAQYRAMLDAAQKGGYAYPAINVTSLTTINGALKAFAESKSDGIIQVSTGGGEFASGTSVKDMALGAIVLAEAVHIAGGKVQRPRRPPHRPLPAEERREASSSPSSPPPPRAAPQAKATSSTATCSTAPSCRSKRTCASPKTSSPAVRRSSRSSSKSKPASSVVKKTVTTPRCRQ